MRFPLSLLLCREGISLCHCSEIMALLWSLSHFSVFLELCGPELDTLWSPLSECCLLANFLPILQTTQPVCILPACPMHAVCLVCNFSAIFSFSLKPLWLVLQCAICLQYSEVKRWTPASISWVINPYLYVEMFLGFLFFLCLFLSVLKFLGHSAHKTRL